MYLRYRVPSEALALALREARRLAMGGLNLTVPLKETALGLVDEATPEAERVGAVNTIVVLPDGRFRGDNTDARGFLRALPARRRLRGGHAVIVGAGGSARAVGAALVAAGCARLTVANRTAARAEALAQRLIAHGARDVAVASLAVLETDAILGDAHVVVNTTSTGLDGDAVPTRWAATPADCLAVDLVYGHTPWLAAAARAGRTTLDGAGMLLHQGALAFEAWTGRRAPLAAMTLALRQAGLVLPRPTAVRTVGALGAR